MRTLLFAAVAAVVLAGHAQAESRLVQSRTLRTEAEAAIKADDLALAQARLEKARELFPAHPGILVRLAVVQTARGETAAAIATLDRYARLGLAYNVDASAQLSKLRADAAFAPVAARLAANAAPKGRLDRAVTVEAAPPVEGAAYDTRRNRLYLSLIGGKGLLVGDAAAGFKPFTAPDATAGLFGIAYDRATDSVFAAEAAGDGVPGSSGPRATALVRIDAATGKVAGRWSLAQDREHWLGDVAVGPDGSVYVSDSRGGEIWRLARGGDRLEMFARSDEIASPQGMVISGDGSAVVVADYSSGLHRVDLATRAVEAVRLPDDASLIGVDGLTAARGGVFATQNGTNPMRVLRLDLAADGRAVSAAATVASGIAEADDLALAAAAGDDLVVIARSGWAGFDGDGKPTGQGPTPAVGWIRLVP